MELSKGQRNRCCAIECKKIVMLQCVLFNHPNFRLRAGQLVRIPGKFFVAEPSSQAGGRIGARKVVLLAKTVAWETPACKLSYNIEI